MISAKLMGDAILALRPNATWALDQPFAYSNLRWMDESQTKPTEQEVMAKYQELVAEDAATEYQRQRAAEYPPVADYLDAVVKGNQAQMQSYIDACLAVKAKYPKPQE